MEVMLKMLVVTLYTDSVQRDNSSVTDLFRVLCGLLNYLPN